MMAGDFNIHDESKGHTSDGFHQLLSDKMLVQHVDIPTSLHDHVLDLIIAPEDLDIVAHVKTSEYLTDHFAVTCVLDVASITKPDKKTVSCRCYSKIIECKMRWDLLSSGLIKQPALDAVALYDQYHTTLCNLLDAHAPVKSKKLSVSIPWFDPAIVEAKRLRRALELKWRKCKTIYNRSAFRKQVNIVRHLLHKAKTQYYTDIVNDSKDDPKKLWQTLKATYCTGVIYVIRVTCG